MGQVEADAELYRDITVLLKEQRALLGSDRRTDDRRPYERWQLVAPYDGESLPEQDAFREKRCIDLSSSGLSFFSARRPVTSHVVVALGQDPFLFFVAEIVHIHEVESHNGTEFFVGCNFQNRVDYEGESQA
ncbi:MAG: hypothetical protein QGG09_16510 [Pirellulaceae bacterium]|jgi:hypothetical protein|nr:hypothetical protein [Pirellulaceae bacterium]HJN08793.1 hypothetical protein [Pirellulaceae bacterium]